MRTKFIEVTNRFNWGKFMVAEFEDHEWARLSEMDGAEGERLLGGRGWGKQHLLVLDLQTGEGAMFMPLGSARHDLNLKHQVWVCPMFEPFLTWLYEQPLDLDALPSVVTLTEEEAPSALSGYRRGQTYVAEGWWHPNAQSGKVHDHPERPGRNWSEPMHRLCEPVYTRREVS